MQTADGERTVIKCSITLNLHLLIKAVKMLAGVTRVLAIKLNTRNQYLDWSPPPGSWEQSLFQLGGPWLGQGDESLILSAPVSSFVSAATFLMEIKETWKQISNECAGKQLDKDSFPSSARPRPSQSCPSIKWWSYVCPQITRLTAAARIVAQIQLLDLVLSTFVSSEVVLQHTDITRLCAYALKTRLSTNIGNQ